MLVVRPEPLVLPAQTEQLVLLVFKEPQGPLALLVLRVLEQREPLEFKAPLVLREFKAQRAPEQPAQQVLPVRRALRAPRAQQALV